MDNEKLRILRLLVESQDKVWSIRQIALHRKINYKSAHTAINQLHSEQIINLNKHGNSMICLFNKQFNESVFLVEYKRLQELLKDPQFTVIHNRLKKIQTQFILLLFGSYAKKKQTKHSDIDLLLITNESKKIEEQIELLPLNIHLTTISYADFEKMLKSKEFSVVSSATTHNIILFGIEDYYRMISNAQSPTNKRS